jgi:hypothetical protein
VLLLHFIDFNILLYFLHYQRKIVSFYEETADSYIKKNPNPLTKLASTHTHIDDKETEGKLNKMYIRCI